MYQFLIRSLFCTEFALHLINVSEYRPSCLLSIISLAPHTCNFMCAKRARSTGMHTQYQNIHTQTTDKHVLASPRSNDGHPLLPQAARLCALFTRTWPPLVDHKARGRSEARSAGNSERAGSCLDTVHGCVKARLASKNALPVCFREGWQQP